ncbi:hypothetical protein J6590_020510 [Homalodisca vitripennis]|nr:hypothetical protein J6590_020510 [Homalodisca vitripennis]
MVDTGVGIQYWKPVSLSGLCDNNIPGGGTSDGATLVMVASRWNLCHCQSPTGQPLAASRSPLTSMSALPAIT